MAVDTFLMFLNTASFVNTPNIAMEPNNSINISVIASKDNDNLSESINDITNNAAASTPIAAAIFKSTPAFNFCWNADRVSPRPPKIFLIFSKTPFPSPVISPKPFINFRIPKRIVANTPVLKISKTLLKSPKEIFSPICLNVLPIALIILSTKVKLS